MKKSISIFTLVFSILCLKAQDLDYTKSQAKILSSSEMYGRGYVKKGMDRAAKHIAAEFKSIGLDFLNDSPFQNFSYDVNSFPCKQSIAVNGEALSAGEDYLISPESGADKTSAKVLKIGKGDIDNLPNPRDLGNRIILLDDQGIEDKDSLGLFYQLRELYSEHMPVMWVNNNRLIWSVARRKMNHAIIEVNPGLIKENDLVSLKIKNKWIEDFKAKNVLGFVKGKESPDSFIVVTGHYDHLGMMGKDACFFGANDNASGVAFIMSMAKYYKENPSKYSILFIAFAGEEAGLIGSKYYTENPLFPLEKIKFLINMDLLGYGEKGITVVNATIHEKEFSYLQAINEKDDLIVKIKKRGEAANSDHYWFEEAGVPSFFIYTMGENQAYHDIYDKNENLTFGEYKDIFNLLQQFIIKL